VKQLLIWNAPDAEDTLRTIRHEGFHQYFDRLVGASPVWLNEGLAEYFEGSRLVKGSWSDGEVQAQHLETLARNARFPLEDFLRVEPKTFYDEKTMHVCYAEAWACVHFLLNSGAEHKQRFDALVDALVGGKRPTEAVAQILDEASLPKLEQEFAEYVRTLK